MKKIIKHVYPVRKAPSRCVLPAYPDAATKPNSTHMHNKRTAASPAFFD